MRKILFLGPMTNVEKGLIGGATISFGRLVQYFEEQNWPIKIINTKKYFGALSSLRNVWHVLRQLIRWSLWAEVIFLNSSRGGARFLAPIGFGISRITGRKFIFRPFGGDLHEYTKEFGRITQWFFKNSVLKADILYLQTQVLLNHYGKSGANLKQLKTSRPAPPKDFHNLEEKHFQKKFVFVGFVNQAKGIDHIVEANAQLDDSYDFHIFGPIMEKKYENLPPKFYKGVLSKEQVIPTLTQYDVLVLPTHYEGEGYPGVILEAYSLGLPVISTRWRSIPEIVINEQTGFLIEPRSTEALIAAVKNIDKENYNQLSQNALKYFQENFDEEKVLGQVKKEILAL